MSSASSTRRSVPGRSRILRGGKKGGPQRRLIGRMLFVSRELIHKPDGMGAPQLVPSPVGKTARRVFEPSVQQHGYVTQERYAQVQQELKESEEK